MSSDVVTEDGQKLELGVVYRLESITMPYAVWNGERFVGPRERFHLRLLETVPRRDGGWVTPVGGPVSGVPLVAEIMAPHCATCDDDVQPSCGPRAHRIGEEPVPNRPLLAAIDEAIAPLLEAEAEANAATIVDEIMVRAFRWQSRHDTPYVPSRYEVIALRRRVAQMDDDDPQRQVIEQRFPEAGSHPE